MTDKIQRFIFDAFDIRGEMVKLSTSSQKMIEAHQYPQLIADLLQQAAAVNVLLATTLKFEGRISIQLQGSGALNMLIVQTTHELGYRGVARFDEALNYSELTFSDLINDGQMCITIEPLKGKRYQGVVPLEGSNLAECVETYFRQSEQLNTRIWLYNDSSQVFGLMLQALPGMLSEDSFQHLEMLASTLTAEESLSVEAEVLLHRLFHDESITSLTEESIEFSCGCSKEKMLNALILLADEEIKEILEDSGEVAMTCEFCLNHFAFSDLDIKQHRSVEGNATQH